MDLLTILNLVMGRIREVMATGEGRGKAPAPHCTNQTNSDIPWIDILNHFQNSVTG